jgi:hypothetical protein
MGEREKARTNAYFRVLFSRSFFFFFEKASSTPRKEADKKEKNTH